MDIMAMAVDLLKKQLGSNLSDDTIANALTGLIGKQGDKLDIGGLVSRMMQGGGLQAIAGSWLGDGANEGINTAQLKDVFGDSKLSAFASQLGVEQDTATRGLAEVLPKIIDSNSQGGSLLDLAGGGDGLMGMAKKLF